MAPTHLTSVASSAFAIDFIRYLQFAPYANLTGATPALAVAEGVVTVRDAGFVSGDGDPNHPNTVHIRHLIRAGISFKGRFRIIFLTSPFLSRYLHMAGPNLIPVSVGMFVRQGARLGPMDDTGSSAARPPALLDPRRRDGRRQRAPEPDGRPAAHQQHRRRPLGILSSNVPFP